MSFFSKLFGRNNKEDAPQEQSAKKKLSDEEKQELLTMVEVVPGLLLPKAMANHWADIEKTVRNTIQITALPVESLTLRQSKFAGYPCIPKGYAYPKGKDGNYLFPLAQINCGELPSKGLLPESGYLQFYIGTDDLHGVSFEEDVPGEFKVLFFEEEEVADAEEDLSFLDEVLAIDESPVFCPHSLIFEAKTEYIGLGDVNGDNNPNFNFHEFLELYPDIEGELEEIGYDTFEGNGHKIGGYAFFTQEDPRGYNNSISDHILLFQMDSDEKIMWGDMGVANFFIHPDDLFRKDFSKVYYQWDCS